MWPFKDKHTQEIARLRNTIARLDAHVAAVHLIVEQLFLRTNKDDRDIIVTQIKAFVAQPAHEPTDWITENADSDEGGQLFRLKADTDSDRLRTPFR